MHLLLRLILNAGALMLVAYVVPGIVVDGFWVALIAAVILGIANALIRPVLIILTLPITILTLGLFTLVINGLLLWLVSSFIEGFSIEGFWAAVLGAFVLWIVSWFTNGILRSGR